MNIQKVYLYPGCLDTVKTSGIGQAVFHQKKMLEAAGVDVTMEDGSQADVIHLNTIFPDSPLKAMKARRQGKKVVYYGHSTMEDFKDSFAGSNLLAGLFKQWIKFCYSTGDIIVTPTEYSKRLLTEYGVKKKIYALSNGVDDSFFCYKTSYREKFRESYGFSENDTVVISVGHYMERKGILDFIDMAKNMPDVHFIWFGHTDRRLMTNTVKRAMRHAPKNLLFPGFISQEELRNAYCGCDVFAFMTHEETEGIVVLEALSCRAKTIVRDIPVYAGWLEKGKNVYKASDSPEFQTIIRSIIDEKLPDLSANGQIVAQNRSLQSMGRELLRIYETGFASCNA